MAATSSAAVHSIGIYRSQDPIENFRIKITLKRVKATEFLPAAPFVTDEGISMKNLSEKQDSGDYYGESVFSWQHKSFNRAEIDFYSQKSNCRSYLHDKYHQRVLQLLQKNSEVNKIFTYVNSDAIVSEGNLKPFTTSANEEIHFLTARMEDLRKRCNFSKSSNKRLTTVLPNMNIVETNPSKEMMKTSHVINSAVQSMYIMADLNPKSSERLGDNEIILCKITLDVNNLMTVCPDFNQDKSKPYVIDYNKNGIKETYHYTIEHASKYISREDQIQESKLYKELYSRHSEFLSSCVGSSFDMPSPGMLRIIINGEIVSAKDFDYDNLYACYFFELSDEWIVPDERQVTNVTQICKTKTVNGEDTAYFCFPFTIELLYRLNQLDENNCENLPRWPLLYIQVLSLDSWSRFRTEGYGHIPIPNTPGSFTKEIRTWRPVTQSPVGEMRRFFIGGSPELEDASYAAIPSTFEGKHLSKFGFRTATSGSVKVHLNILHQSQAYLASESQKKRMGTLIERLGDATRHSGVAAVLLAFQRARQRMMAAREKIVKT